MSVRKIEISIEELKEKIERWELMERLKEDEVFKAFILEGFMGKERIQDLLTKKVSPSFQDPANTLYVDTQIQAIGAFRMFMLYTEQEGRIAKQELAEAEDERILAMEEEAI